MPKWEIRVYESDVTTFVLDVPLDTAEEVLERVKSMPRSVFRLHMGGGIEATLGIEDIMVERIE